MLYAFLITKNRISAGGATSLAELNIEWLKVHNTETCRTGKINPKFNLITITASKLCSGNFNAPIKIEYWSHNESGEHTYKGETIISINEINDLKIFNFEFWNKYKNNKPCGHLYVENFVLKPNYSFSQYLKGGINISTIVCIDFTQSNLPMTDPNS